MVTAMTVIGSKVNIMDWGPLFQALVTATQEPGFTTPNKATDMKNGLMDQPSKGNTQMEKSTATENSNGPIKMSSLVNLTTTK
jgi:hypothetical protein